MTVVFTENTQFTDPITGNLINNGYVYFGDPGVDPVLNPKNVYDNRELTGAPLANPQRTGTDGRTLNKVWVDGKYSMKVTDADGVQKLLDMDRGETTQVGNSILINSLGTNDVVATGSPTITSLVNNQSYIFSAPAANTGAMTLKIDALAAKAIKKGHDQSMQSGDVKADQRIVVVYNSTDDWFEIQSAISGNVTGNFSVGGTTDLTGLLTLDNNVKYSPTDFAVSAETDESQRAIFAGGTFNGGDLTADTITDDDATSAFENIYEVISGYNLASFYTFSIYIKKDSIGRATRFPMVRFVYQGATTENNDIKLDTSTGEIDTNFQSTAGVSGVESVGDYWRLYISAQSVAANTTALCRIYPAIGAGAGWTNSAAATGSITAWGAIATEGDALLDYNAGLAVNVITQPEDFSDAAWTKIGTDLVTANTDTAPDIGGGAYITLEGDDYGGTGLGGDLNLVAGSDGDINLTTKGTGNVKAGGAFVVDSDTVLHTKVLDIGDWNMDTTANVAVAHGLDHTKIRNISAIIRSDGDTNYFHFPVVNTSATSTEMMYATTTNIVIQRANAGQFDSAGFSSTSFNRGWITIQYTD